MQPEEIIEAELVHDDEAVQTEKTQAASPGLIEQILSPQSLQWMMLSGGGLLVVGFVVWLWSIRVFENPLIASGLVGTVTLGLLGGGVAMVRFTRYQLAGRGIALLGAVALPLNLWLYDAQGLITLSDGGHLWIPAALICLIYGAVARVLRDSTFVYALVGGVVMTGLLFLADESIGRLWALMPPVTFLVVIGWLATFAERLFTDDEGDFSRKNFGLAFHRAGLIVVTGGLTLLLGGHLVAIQSYLLFGKLWPLLATSQPQKLWALGIIAGSALGFGVQSKMQHSRLYRRATALMVAWLIPASLNFFAIEITISHAAIAAATIVLLGNVFVAWLRRTKQDGSNTSTANQVADVSPAIAGCLATLATGQLVAQSIGLDALGIFSSLGWISTLQILTAGLAAWACAWNCQSDSGEPRHRSTTQHLLAATGAGLVVAAGWSVIFVQTFLTTSLAAALLVLIPVGLATLCIALKGKRSIAGLQTSTTVAMTAHLVIRSVIEFTFAASIFDGLHPSLQWSAFLAIASCVYWVASLGSLKNLARVLSYTAGTLSIAALGHSFGMEFGYFLVLVPMIVGVVIRIAESLKVGGGEVVSENGETKLSTATAYANLMVLVAGIGGVLLALSRWVVSETDGTLMLVTAALLVGTTVVSLLTKQQAWRTTFRALIVALVGASLCVFDGWLAIDGWHKGELCSILGGVILLGLGHVAWSREGDKQDDAASVSLLLGSFLVAVPLLIGLLAYRFGFAVDAGWMWFHEIAAIAVGLILFGAGVCCKLRSTTISGATLLGIYLLSLLALIRLPDQLQSISVMMMVGGGLFFATALLMSIYRDRLVSLPRRIREGEGVYRILKWR